MPAIYTGTAQDHEIVIDYLKKLLVDLTIDREIRFVKREIATLEKYEQYVTKHRRFVD